LDAGLNVRASYFIPTLGDTRGRGGGGTCNDTCNNTFVCRSNHPTHICSLLHWIYHGLFSAALGSLASVSGLSTPTQPFQSDTVNTAVTVRVELMLTHWFLVEIFTLKILITVYIVDILKHCMIHVQCCTIP